MIRSQNERLLKIEVKQSSLPTDLTNLQRAGEFLQEAGQCCSSIRRGIEAGKEIYAGTPLAMNALQLSAKTFY